MPCGIKLANVYEGCKAADHFDKSEALFGTEPFYAKLCQEDRPMHPDQRHITTTTVSGLGPFPEQGKPGCLATTRCFRRTQDSSCRAFSRVRYLRPQCAKGDTGSGRSNGKLNERPGHSGTYLARSVFSDSTLQRATAGVARLQTANSNLSSPSNSSPICRPFTRPYDRGEVFADALAHTVGVGLALIGVAALISKAQSLTGAHAVSVWIYCLGLITTFGISATYNLWPMCTIKMVLRRLDHSAIYFFIAATYSPFLLGAEQSLEWLIERAEEAVIRDGIKALLVDPWNELEHARRRDETETQYTARAIRALKKLAMSYDVLVIVVVHPTKSGGGKEQGDLSLYDADGSAHWVNKPDIGIVIEREIGSSRCIVHGRKFRFSFLGHKGATDFIFDPAMETYSE